MKKFYFIAIPLIIVAITAYYLHKTKSSTFQRRDTLFLIDEIETIDRIAIGAKNNSIDLIKENEIWKCSNEEINPERLNDMFVLAQKLEAISPAAKSDVSRLETCLIDGTSVSFYSGRRVINAYRLCSEDMKIFASRMKSDKIFQVEARGYPNVDLTKIFSEDPLYWTKNKVINFGPEEITNVRMYYPDDPEKSFKLEISSKDNFHLSDHKDTDLSGSADREFISVYLYFFGNIPYYRLHDNEKSVIIDLKEPFFILNIESTRQSAIELYAFRKINPEDNETDKTEFYGKIIGSEVVKLKYTDFDPVLLDLKDFLKK